MNAPDPPFATPNARTTVTVAKPSWVRPLSCFPVSEVWGELVASPSLVKNFLAPGQITVLFAPSAHFKSVFAIDFAMCAGTGHPFHGFKVRRVPVLYVAGEGHAGIRKRLRAWLLDRGYTDESEPPWVHVTTAPADLMSKPGELRATVAEVERFYGAPVGLVVIDTLAANFGAGDENHATDMQVAINNARNASPGAAVLLVHHVGHGQSERERGSYALVGAADIRIRATYDDVSKVVELEWLKLKDDERPEPLAFAWRKVALGWFDEEGEELTSVVLDRLNGPAPPRTPRAVGMGKNQETAMRALRTLLTAARKNLQERGDDPTKACILIDGWKADLARRGIDRRRFHELLNDLVERRLIVIDRVHVAPVEGVP
ncbi:hypothetical protein DSM104443_01158 [Usitatibacter rugosus]|uniref:AAA domain-containing protein n=1 Tax=Usitatibacter rugosus TaxID=2732067 RepID=A0A6M4GSS1_9PROT|nr:AAA family ATPase [Usitatibacter rugosus]QJR10105.1 hypothetical protein DSM104443_01158 [Usitatibacter rugosus]